MGTGGGGSSAPKMQAHGLSRMASRPMDSSQPCRVDELEMVWVPIARTHSKQPSESLLVLNCQKTNFCSDLCWLEVIKKMETWMFFFYFLLFVRFFLRQERWRRRRQQRQWRRRRRQRRWWRRQRRWWYQFSAFQLKCVFLNGKLWMEKNGTPVLYLFPAIVDFCHLPEGKIPQKKIFISSYFELCGKLGSGSNPAAVKELTC